MWEACNNVLCVTDLFDVYWDQWGVFTGFCDQSGTYCGEVSSQLSDQYSCLKDMGMQDSEICTDISDQAYKERELARLNLAKVQKIQYTALEKLPSSSGMSAIG